MPNIPKKRKGGLGKTAAAAAAAAAGSSDTKPFLVPVDGVSRARAGTELAVMSLVVAVAIAVGLAVAPARRGQGLVSHPVPTLKAGLPIVAAAMICVTSLVAVTRARALSTAVWSALACVGGLIGGTGCLAAAAIILGAPLSRCVAKSRGWGRGSGQGNLYRCGRLSHGMLSMGVVVVLVTKDESFVATTPERALLLQIPTSHFCRIASCVSAPLQHDN